VTPPALPGLAPNLLAAIEAARAQAHAAAAAAIDAAFDGLLERLSAASSIAATAPNVLEYDLPLKAAAMNAEMTCQGFMRHVGRHGERLAKMYGGRWFVSSQAMHKLGLDRASAC
jgi:hypothetical protein